LLHGQLTNHLTSSSDWRYEGKGRGERGTILIVDRSDDLGKKKERKKERGEEDEILFISKIISMILSLLFISFLPLSLLLSISLSSTS